MACSAAKKFNRVSHVIFDLDGVILDTEVVYKHAVAAIAARYNKRYTPEIQGKVIGTVEKESARIAVTEMGLPMPPEEFQLEFRQRAYSAFKKSQVPFMSGAETLIKHLHRNKIPMAVATSSSEGSFKIKVQKHMGLFDLFSHIVFGGSDAEVKQGKPHPDIFLVCAKRFCDSPNPDKCLVFEDAPNGVTAARAAGMQVIMVPDENIPQELRKDASIVINCLDQAPLEKFGLPPLKQ